MDAPSGQVAFAGAWRLRLLGGFSLGDGVTVINLPLSAQRLLAFVALGEEPRRRPFVAGSLWAESSEVRAQASLRSALWRLGQAAPGTVIASAGRVALSPELQLDVRSMVSAARSLFDSAPGDGPASGADLGVFTGDLLPDWYDDWVTFERERLRHLRMNAMEALAYRLSTQHRYAAAVECALAVIACERLRESAHRTLMQVHVDHGNLSEALRQFELYRTTLRYELGLDPSPHMLALVAEITRR